MAGSHRVFCSSEPKRLIDIMASDPWTEANVRSPLSPRSSSCIIKPAATLPSPPHPYPLMVGPKTPSCASSGTSSIGNVPSR